MKAVARKVQGEGNSPYKSKHDVVTFLLLRSTSGEVPMVHSNQSLMHSQGSKHETSVIRSARERAH